MASRSDTLSRRAPAPNSVPCPSLLALRALPPLPRIAARACACALEAQALASKEAQWPTCDVKVDPDTLLVPHNLRGLLDELSLTLGTDQPYQFGLVACRAPPSRRTLGAPAPRVSKLCYASGGAGYGLTRSAVVALNSVARTDRGLLLNVRRHFRGRRVVTV